MHQLPFARGERVKLREPYARALMLGRRQIDWLKRRGTVVYCNPTVVHVRWDGRRSVDNLPIKGVEIAYDR